MASPSKAPAAETVPPVRRINLSAAGLIAVIFATEAVIGILLLAINPQYPSARLHAGVRYTGLALSVYGAAKMPGQPFGGWLADRASPHLVLIGGLALSLPVIVVMERFQLVWVYIASWAAFGLTLAVVWPTVYAIIGHRFRASLQGRLLALVSMGQIAGTALGTGVGAVIVDHFSYTAAFGLALLLEIGALGLALTTVHRDTTASASSPAQNSNSGIPVERGVLRSIANVNAALLIVLIMLVSVAVAMLTPDLKPYSDTILNLPYSTFVLLLVPPALVAALLLLPAGYIADGFGRNLPMLAGLSLFAMGLFLLTLGRNPVYVTLCACLAASGYVLALPALSASLLDLSADGSRGLLTGISTSIQAIGLVIGPAIGGFLVDGFGALVPFRVAATILAATLVLAAVYASRTRSLYKERLQTSPPG